jgi:peptidoglycan hydrolase CwlO-like protein
MKIDGKKFFLLILTSILFLGSVVFVRAQTCDSVCNQGDVSCLTSRINDCQQKVTNLQGQANTLANQIAQFDAQIKLMTLKISQTQDQITLLGGRIDQLGDSLTSLTAAFSSRAVETYKLSRFENNFIFILSAIDISDATSRLHYLQKIQEEDRNLLDKLQTAQTTYQGQKTDQETLKKQLTVQQANLNTQKAAKARLLKDTQNSEANYKRLLAEASAEYEAIQGILAGRGQETEVGHVNQGDKIATIIQGSSCNSGGTHLHFTVSQGSIAQNPFNYLKSGIDFTDCSGSSCGSSDGDSFNPSGSWDWPVSPKIQFNQGYGSTWAVRNTYIGRIYSAHNGIDIDSDASSDVHAVKSGILFRGSYVGGGGCSLRYDRVRNDDGGLDVLYLHINYVL